jgi:hypothetical protein
MGRPGLEPGVTVTRENVRVGFWCIHDDWTGGLFMAAPNLFFLLFGAGDVALSRCWIVHYCTFLR